MDLAEKINEFEIDETLLPDDALFVSFLRKMLLKNPETRATVVDLLDDPWLTDYSSNFIDLFEAGCDSESNQSIIKTDSSESEDEYLLDYHNSRSRKLSILEEMEIEEPESPCYP
jgi:serine/threonine protein kinase